MIISIGIISRKYLLNAPPVTQEALPVLKNRNGNTNPLIIKNTLTQSDPMYRTLIGVVLKNSGGYTTSMPSSLY